MCRKMTIGVAAAVVLAFPGLALAITGLQSTTLPGMTTPHANSSASKKSGHGELIRALKEAHALLTKADHDYNGHRAKAAHEVESALRALGQHHQSTSTTRTSATKTPAASGAHHSGQGSHEAQSASDTQMRQAQHILQAVSSRASGHHSSAVGTHVHAAVAHINTALSIK